MANWLGEAATMLRQHELSRRLCGGGRLAREGIAVLVAGDEVTKPSGGQSTSRPCSVGERVERSEMRSMLHSRPKTRAESVARVAAV